MSAYCFLIWLKTVSLGPILLRDGYSIDTHTCITLRKDKLSVHWITDTVESVFQLPTQTLL